MNTQSVFFSKSNNWLVLQSNLENLIEESRKEIDFQPVVSEEIHKEKLWQRLQELACTNPVIATCLTENLRGKLDQEHALLLLATTLAEQNRELSFERVQSIMR